MAYLTAALQRFDAGIGADPLLARQPPGEFPLKEILAALIRRLDMVSPEASRPGNLLILDDYHQLTARPIHEGMAFLLEHLPSNLHVVISSRSDPPLPLARWRGRGLLTEIRLDHLRFTVEEAGLYLAACPGGKLRLEDAAALAAKTEGWITGLQMAALAMQGRPQAAAFIREFSGTDRYILDYLLEEVLKREPSEIQDFLYRTSVLERMTSPLCDALMGGRRPGKDTPGDGQAVLEYLENANLFLIPLDERREWYRYHHLFADLLRKRLLQTAGAEGVAALHRKAAAWFEANGSRAEAIEHALLAHDFVLASDLIADELPGAFWDRGEFTTIARWLKAIPGEVIRGRMALYIYYAFVLFLAGRNDAAAGLLREAEDALGPPVENTAPPCRELHGMAAAVRAFMARFRGDADAVMCYTQKALALLPAENTVWRGGVAMVAGDAHSLRGDTPAAGTAFAEALRIGREAGNGCLALLDIRTDKEIQQAILAVHGSRQSERVQAYSRAQGMDTGHEVAVVVQRLIRADIAGVLFTADPVTGSHMCMTGNYVHGLGERLVSGEATPRTFSFKRPRGRYVGPPELKGAARKLYRLARRLESELGSPQDMEWAVSRRKLFLLQSRPITTLRGYNPATGEWNATLTGDFLWTNANFSEAVPDVMTPSTWSMWQIFYLETDPLTIGNRYPLAGNIGGRPYANLSLLVSLLHTVGMNVHKALRSYEDALGRVPEGIDIPLLPLNFNSFLTMIPANIKWERQVKERRKMLPAFVAASLGRCKELRQRIQTARTSAGLVSLWREELRPYFLECCWMLRAGMKVFADPAAKLRRDLIKLAGTEDAHALLSAFSAGPEQLASLGPVEGLSDVVRGRMRREEYFELYGHRGPHECELAEPHPSEDQTWLDRQLAEFAKAPLDVEALLAKQRAEYDAAWRRLQARYARRSGSIGRRIDRISAAARMRERIRSEFTRAVGVIRSFALRAGEMTGLGDDIFFLSLDEMIAVLTGDGTATAFIPARRATHARYSDLPPYPAVINGRFDPIRWAADPKRRSDYFDAHASAAAPASGAITGFPGAAGRVEGLVRRLDCAEEGGRLQPGEILVTMTTNIGWTPLFPRVAAIVTDVGAPLSHAAIVARELGIPAVVGCGDATMRLRTGDRVRVDGGRGIVEILGT